MSDYVRPDGLVARTDQSTPCRCGNPDCAWTERDDNQRDRIEYAPMTADRDALADVINLRPKRKAFIMTDTERAYHGMFGSCVCDRDYNPATDQWDTIIKTQPECKKHG